ncbi:unnamed protein product [Mytilus edulis]|uniref:YqaJ viral recombinase domain-containing protein n=1 Tax=Mytilus edulis TaxID=6550 RepID=A0A8S3TTZ9_MYTED|nr:unnamed protein product [Mytilus edulis]
MVTGNGASHLNELLVTMNSPGLRQATFGSIEEEIGQMWHTVLEEEMLAAGAEERRIAIENNNYNEGVPSITIIADGGWSKGPTNTRIMLQVGRALNTQTEPPEHVCFKNWSASSQAMESDILVEGFKQAEKVHGLRYMQLIADGDSSVYAKIQEEVPVWGKFVTKMECSNHACKCLRSNLEKLVNDNPNYKGQNKRTKTTRVKIVSAVRCAIRMRSKESNRSAAIKLLAHDIRNSVHHIFGNHKNCSNFCKANEKRNETSIASSDNLSTNDIPDIFESQSLLWSEVFSQHFQEKKTSTRNRRNPIAVAKKKTTIRNDTDNSTTNKKQSSKDTNYLKAILKKKKLPTQNGYRFIDLQQMQSFILQVTMHSISCERAVEIALKGISPYTDLTEIKSYGIACILGIKCKGCNYIHTMNTSSRLQTSKDKINRFEVNVYETKYCYICSRALNTQTEPPEHVCFKNWSASSQAMESDILVEGFKQAEKEEVPIWGKFVTKMECSNHACKCLRSNLEKLVNDNPNYKGQNKLTKTTRVKIVSAVRCAIRMRSKESNRSAAIKLLAHDIRNSVHHILFGNHKNCSNFCKANEKRNETSIASSDNLSTNDIPDIFESQSLLWSEGTSLLAQEESRFSSNLIYTDLDKQMLSDITLLLNRLATKSERLVGNDTTNIAESWMHVRSKFDGGKFYNLCNRGSWHARCYGAAARQNLELLYSSFKGNAYTVKGLQEERNSIHEYILKKTESGVNVNVESSGLIIDKNHKFLAGSPDGLVNENGEMGLIEIKNILQKKNMSFIQATKKVSNFCLQYTDEKVQLKKKHNYYFQCQGLLNISGLPWLDFIARSTSPYQIHIERIYRDEFLVNTSKKKTSTRNRRNPRKIAVAKKKTTIRKDTDNSTTNKKQSSKNASNSKTTIKPSTSTTEQYTVKRKKSMRCSNTKFVGRRIKHKWMVNEEEIWYEGTVLAAVTGKDGERLAEYDILYDGEDSSCIVNHLVEDFRDSSVQFIDL